MRSRGTFIWTRKNSKRSKWGSDHFAFGAIVKPFFTWGSDKRQEGSGIRWGDCIRHYG